MCSSSIQAGGHKCQFLSQRSAESTRCEYNLCQECYSFLVERKNDFKYLWPGFLWYLLSGSHEPTFYQSYNFFSIYSAEKIWTLIPETMRPWWIHSISSINNHGDYIYSECTISNPPPMIIDRSDGLDEFERYVESGDWIQLKGAIEMETIFMPNLLCTMSFWLY